jgi:hypothetical protein
MTYVNQSETCKTSIKIAKYWRQHLRFGYLVLGSPGDRTPHCHSKRVEFSLFSVFLRGVPEY